jgi:nucleoside-diphosphate-sugar epimerase
MEHCSKPLPEGALQTIAVTGATGFIGAAVCRRLLADGFRVRALVRSPDKSRKLEAEGVEIIRGDLFTPSALMKLIADADAVVHCAGAVRGASQEQFDRVNVEGIRQLLHAFERNNNAPPVLSLSSLAAREPGLSFYAASKYHGEEVLTKEAASISWMILRPPAVYGPGDRELLPLFRLMARGLAPIPGSPEARFSMLFIDDLAAAIVAWLGSGKTVNGVFTLEDGHCGGYAWSDVSDIIAEICQRPVRLFSVPAWMLDVPARINRMAAKFFGYAPMLTPEKLCELRHTDWVCDSKALCSVLEWQPEVTLAEGLRKTPGWSGYQNSLC